MYLNFANKKKKKHVHPSEPSQKNLACSTPFSVSKTRSWQSLSTTLEDWSKPRSTPTKSWAEERPNFQKRVVFFFGFGLEAQPVKKNTAFLESSGSAIVGHHWDLRLHQGLQARGRRHAPKLKKKNPKCLRDGWHSKIVVFLIQLLIQKCWAFFGSIFWLKTLGMFEKQFVDWKNGAFVIGKMLANWSSSTMLFAISSMIVFWAKKRVVDRPDSFLRRPRVVDFFASTPRSLCVSESPKAYRRVAENESWKFPWNLLGKRAQMVSEKMIGDKLLVCGKVKSVSVQWYW